MEISRAAVAASISIHALREEGDGVQVREVHDVIIFQSTPSARRATSYRPHLGRCRFISIHALREEGDLDIGGFPFVTFRDFNPRPPRGGRQFYFLRGFIEQIISIHALREEGDALKIICAISIVRFQSTPSARRATYFGGHI